MKYEMIFGDERLFDGAPIDCIFVVRLQDGHKIYYGEYPKITTEPLFVVQSDYITFAMRRIIKTPVWTVADQKAGRLPEVGCKILGKKTGINTVLFNNGDYIVIVSDGHCIGKYIADEVFAFFEPIESPEEKAARLREEWCNEAGVVCSLGMTTLTRIYDALLSGDLPVPSKE